MRLNGQRNHQPRDNVGQATSGASQVWGQSKGQALNEIGLMLAPEFCLNSYLVACGEITQAIFLRIA